MQISCPGCKARIQVPDDKIKPTGTKVKCGKCTKIFTVKKKSAAAEAPNSAPRPAEAAASSPSSGESLVSDDPFGADMDNFKTQLRPMGGARDDLFGGAEDLDSSPAPKPKQPDADDGESLFGSSSDLDEDLTGGSFSSAPVAEEDNDPFASDIETNQPASSDDSIDQFVQDIRSQKEALAQEEADDPFASPPAPKADAGGAGKDSLDNLFGKGLDGPDDDVGALFDAEPKRTKATAASADVDALFDKADDDSPPAPPPDASALDNFFDDEPTPEPKPKKPTKKPEPESLDLVTPGRPKPRGGGEDLAAELNLEPALKEEDAPLPPQQESAPQAAATAPAKKKPFPMGKVIMALLVLAVVGGGAAVYTQPELRAQAGSLIGSLPVDKLTALLPGASEPKAQPIFISTQVTDTRSLQGARGDNIFVIEGTIRNDYDHARSFIKLRASLIDAEGNVVETREAFAGNVLTNEEIRGLERVRVDGMLNRSVGAGLANLNVRSGATVPYMVIFYDIEEPSKLKPQVTAIASEPGSS